MQEHVVQQTANTAIQLMEGKPDIIIIRGAPGSGKTQTAKSLSKYFPKGVRIEVDVIRQMVISVDWKKQQEHIDMLQATTKLVIEFLQFGFRPVIVVDTFSGDKINSFIETLYQHDSDVSIKIFGLTTTDIELKRRLENRKDEEFRDFPICKKLNDDLLKLKRNDEFLIDTTGYSAVESADRVYGQISNDTSVGSDT